METPLKGAYVVEMEPVSDERGFFARSFCSLEFSKMGLNPNIAQCNITVSSRKGTLRGMHYQAPPHEEAKLVRCTFGAVYDVIIDLRPGSAAYCRWFGLELSALNHKALYVPEGFAHGFLTLTENAEVFYQMSSAYHAESARGVRFDDPAFGIKWPGEVAVIAGRDRTYPDFLPNSARGA